jgi:hypothetical protein
MGAIPLKRKDFKPTNKIFYAYDLETSNIAAGTPTVKYITAYGDGWKLSKSVDNLEQLRNVLLSDFLTDERLGHQYIAWNGNKFDVYFIGLALLDTDYIIRPYITRGKALRGIKILRSVNDKKGWEFLDGIAMTGVTKKLRDFAKCFAPGYTKLELDFDKIEFDSTNADHVLYAERDSEALFHATKRCDAILRGLTGGLGLHTTIGALGIKVFQSQIPDSVLSWKPGENLSEHIFSGAMRGGFCFISRKYSGPIWKYDINQAYAAAMRDAQLPCGRCSMTDRYISGLPGIYNITALSRKSTIPFYYKVDGKSFFSGDVITQSWLCSNEIEQLKNEGWRIKINAGYVWSESFNMKNMVDGLEVLRSSDPDGPNGPLGTMCKMIGNNAYGKTVERLGGLDIIMSRHCPPGCARFDENLDYIWCKPGSVLDKPYHRPQLGAFITAHVRMVLRRAILLAPDAWIYADTDCLAFTRPVAELDIDPKRYGAWKIEAAGENYSFITKKVYSNFDATEKHAKGMNVNKLTSDDFKNWFEGRPPTQKQIQRQNFVKIISGFDMFIEREKIGQKIA